MDILEDLGNCVKINDVIIPAVNIQVEGFPKWIDATWYGIYFEVLFEDGTLWEVEQRHADLPVVIMIYPFWGVSRKLFCVVSQHENWVDFLNLYQTNLFVRDRTKELHWLDYKHWMAA
jgi:hypothetical protein